MPSLPILYKQIERMIKQTVLDAQVARDIVRKSGLVGGDSGTTLQEQLLTPPLQHNRPQVPRRRVQNDLFWPYPRDPVGSPTDPVGPGNTYWDERHSFGAGEPVGDTTKDTLSDSQKRWNGIHFVGFSDERRLPLGGSLEVPTTTNTSDPRRTGRCWVGGATSYDPFPYPGYYLWADLAEAWVEPYIGAVFLGRGPTPIDQYEGSPGEASGPVILKVWGSIDQGATWLAPWPPTISNAGAANYALNLNPLYTPAPTEDGYLGLPGGDLLETFRRDDVIFKFTLTSADTENWVEFETVGIRIFGFEP